MRRCFTGKAKHSMLKNPAQFAFTEARVKNLTPPGSARRVRYRDSVLPGFFLRVTANGVKTFAVYRKVNGKPVDLTIGRWPAIPVEMARKIAQGALGEIAGGIDPQAAKRAIRDESTLKDLFDHYLALHAKPRKRTWAEDERRFKGYLKGWSNRRLSDIGPADVQGWHARTGRDHGHFAANRAHSLLRKMFNFARQRGWKGQNPAVGVLRFKERTRERFLDANELRRFFVALQAEADSTARDFFLLALLTGARRANVLGMCWEDLDLSRGLWRIPGDKSKSGEALIVVLAPHVVGLLEERKRTVGTSPWVLPSAASKTGHYVEPKSAWGRLLAWAELTGLVDMIAVNKGKSPEDSEAAQRQALADVGRIRFDALARRMPKGTDPFSVILDRYRAEAKKLGIDPDKARMRDLRIHDLRRTLGSWQAASGSSLPIIGRSLGHRQTQTTAIYARLSLDPVRESVERAATAMLNVSSSGQGKP